MANVSNVNRQATARTLESALETLKDVAGLVLQTHRAYESAARGGRGLRQDEVASTAGTNQTAISNLEQGKSIPPDPTLSQILAACGLNMAAGEGGHALLQVLRVVRDEQANIKKIAKQKPA